jgi:hypothetical protein
MLNCCHGYRQSGTQGPLGGSWYIDVLVSCSKGTLTNDYIFVMQNNEVDSIKSAPVMAVLTPEQ